MRSGILAFALLASISACQQAFAQEQIDLQTKSDQGTFMVKITWTPHEIGSSNSFDIRFVDPETGEEIEDVVYDFSIFSGDHRELLNRGQMINHQEFTFQKQGSYMISIENIEGLGENAQIPIQVSPEFTPNVVGTVVVTTLAGVVFFMRRNSNNLFSQPIN